MPRRATALVLSALLAVPAAADAPDPFAAVGWLGYGAGPKAGTPACSGVLIAPQIVLTAAHCVIDPKTGAARNLATMTFAPGMRGGHGVTSRHGTAAYVLPMLPPGAGLDETANIAAVWLDSPVPADLALPMDIAPNAVEPGQDLVTIGYPRTDPENPVRQEGCRIAEEVPPVIGLTCGAVSGFSGGAVMVHAGDKWQLAAIMVAQASQNPDFRLIAVAIPPDLVDRLSTP